MMKEFEHFFAPVTRTDEQKRISELLHEKLEEYEKHFGSNFDTESIIMTEEEMIENIDKCLKHNRLWNGYIVPEVDYSDDVFF